MSLSYNIQNFTKIISKTYIQSTSGFMPFLLIGVYTLLALESFTYEGFVSKYILLNTKYLSYLVLCVLLIVNLLMEITGLKQGFLEKVFFLLNRFITLPLYILYFFIELLESTNYPNYIFSTYHLNISGYRHILLFSLSIVLISSDIFRKKTTLLLSYSLRQIKQVTRKQLSYFLLQCLFLANIGFIFYDYADNFIATLTQESVNLTFIKGTPFQQRLCVRLGGANCNNSFGWIQTYGNFIKAESEPDSVIYIPPQKESWEMEGNVDYIRYYIYPRRPVNSPDLQADIPSEADYVLITYGLWYSSIHTWPRIAIPPEKIEKIVFINRETLETQTLENTGYIPNFDQELWGIIKLKK